MKILPTPNKADGKMVDGKMVDESMAIMGEAFERERAGQRIQYVRVRKNETTTSWLPRDAKHFFFTPLRLRAFSELRNEIWQGLLLVSRRTKALVFF